MAVVVVTVVVLVYNVTVDVKVVSINVVENSILRGLDKRFKPLQKSFYVRDRRSICHCYVDRGDTDEGTAKVVRICFDWHV